MTHEAVKSVLADYEIIYRVSSDMLKKADSAGDKLAQREFWLGMAAYEMKEYELSFEHLCESERLSPSAEVATRLALCRWRQQNLEDAARWIKLAIERDPRGSVVAHCLGTTSTYSAVRACIELQMGNIHEALELANLAISHSRKDALAYVVRANALLATGDQIESQRSIEAAAKHAPPYLHKQIELFRVIVRDLINATTGGKPFVADFGILMMRRAI